MGAAAHPVRSAAPASAGSASVALAAWIVVQRALAVAALIALAPPLAVIAVAVAILSRRAPLVAHLRIGRDGRPFRMLKFRTMWGGADDAAESPGCCALVAMLNCAPDALPAPKRSDDPRVGSRLARFLRRYSLDELPQLWHVANGEMVLVGPRPLLRSELDAYYGSCAAEVLSVAPGMTGLWQTMGRSRLGYRQRRRMDLFLVRHRSVRLDLRILARTLPQVISGANSW
jgi:exopolysaccharide production protein ExoY